MNKIKRGAEIAILPTVPGGGGFVLARVVAGPGRVGGWLTPLPLL